MTDDPIHLDDRRNAVAQEATEVRRRRLVQFQSDQAELRQRQEELETLLLAEPAETWPEAAAKAQYLIQLFADTVEGQEPRRKELIAHALDDFARLSKQPTDSS